MDAPMLAAEPAQEDVAPLHLDMAIRNFGPIKRASLSLRPLTIFIGPSNTGKSYAAMLAHSIISSGLGTARRHMATAAPDGGKAISSAMHKNMAEALLSLAPGRVYKCPPRLASQITSSCRQRLAARLERELELNFASPLQSLARGKTKRFSVDLKAGGQQILRYGASGFELGSPEKISISLQATRASGLPQLDAEFVAENELLCRVHPGLIAHKFAATAARRLCSMIEERIMPRMIPGLPAGSFYFPAGRTGILQAHRTISSGIIDGTSLGGTRGGHAPGLPGVVSDFATAIINIQPLRGPYMKHGEQIESDMLDGRVSLIYPGRHALPELVYRNHADRVPIHRASSTVSEIAPITLYLKHSMGRGGMVVIEEPEAHLHPRNQIRLAGHLVGLVRGGANVVITTHSGTLFEAVSQYLEVSPLPPEKRRRAVGTDNLYLCPNEVAPHLFAPDGKGGCVARKIDMSAEDGFLQDEFVDAEKFLYDINIRIEEYMN